MNYSTVIKISVLFVLPLLLLGCFEDHASQFHLDDINQVEWAPPDRSSSSLSYSADIEADRTSPKILEFEVQLIGAQTGSDRSIGVSVSATNGDEGSQFNLLTPTVTIPANSNHGTAQVEVVSENVGNGRDFSFTLELQETSDLEVAVNMKDMNVSVDKDVVSLSASFSGEDDSDPSGSSSLTGFSKPDHFDASVSVQNFAPNATFSWQVHNGTCAAAEDVVGDAADYPAIETDGDGSGSVSAEIDGRIFQAGPHSLRIQDDLLNIEVACTDYE